MSNIYAEIITIGDEILYGQTLDTNSHWLSGELDKAGIRVKRKTTVGDNEKDISEALKKAENDADIILITGGLGPTKDDLTKPCLVKYFNTRLILNQEALNDVTSYLKSKGREITELNRKQAEVPENATIIRNEYGTAPGIWIEREGKIFISMPGVPREMKFMITGEVLKKLRYHFKTGLIYHKIIHTVGIGESWLSDLISDWEDNLPEHIRLAYLPSLGQVKLRLTATGNDINVLKKEVDQQINQLKEIAGEYIFGYDQQNLESVIGELLVQQKKTIAVAESCSGGYIAHLITSIAGSSRYFNGSIVPYQNKIKTRLLEVNKKTIDDYGAVSKETVSAMAKNVREIFHADIGLATSGIAGPGGGTDEKPVGTVWIALSEKDHIETEKLSLGKDRGLNIQLSGVYLLNLLRKRLIK